MVKLYSGTPGSGKSYHAASDIYTKLRQRKNVISTMPININVVTKGRRKIGIYEFIFIQELTPKYLIEFANHYHTKGKEGQTIVVIDEAEIIFNSRMYGDKGRMEWLIFFSVHRHYGFDIILICQFDRQLDRQIRCQIENEYKHRKINNRGMLFLLPVKIFAVIEYWYVNKTKVGAHLVKFKRRVAKIYNSYETNDIIAQKLGVITEKVTSGTEDTSSPSPSATTPSISVMPDRVETGAGGPRRDEGRLSHGGWWVKELSTAEVKY